ncbi:hypothetical protein PJU52_003148 [Klebsiella michiganensis]|uniref:hypothetical protein n=1 Tax=Klebsiella michiganensis TaxID=1134687 RepID=UPI00224544E2|nr:hypothetical protein [Klebsiella michiganensis]EKV7897603.1 hypothetical protein [Klebsiella michiganensis]MCW9670715.1 hypothetical protein [Klebsiella michiganensis]MDM4166995.1 hypothetical protein [Klebsiella michiganensis]HBM3158673.1 hypothetical protein [Klebsiella michiganensis]HCQ8236992.1 hypothetical protein [Klebsiella michiganensis]
MSFVPASKAVDVQVFALFGTDISAAFPLVDITVVPDDDLKMLQTQVAAFPGR